MTQIPADANRFSFGWLRARLLALLALVPCIIAAPALAQTPAWPAKPIRLVHGFVPGGNVDITARLIATPLAELLGQPVVVEGRPGAGGTVAAAFIAKAEPDGYTLFAMASGHSTSPGLYRKLPYDPVKDFTMVSLIASFPFVIAVAPGHPAKTLSELLQKAKSEPGRVTLAHAGVGTGMHLSTVLLQSRTGVQFNLIPYKGGNAAPVAAAQGETEAAFDTPAGMNALIQGGKLRPLAITTGARWKNWPDVPTIAEIASPGYEVKGWIALAGPRDLPRPVVARLSQALHQGLARADVIERFQAMGTGASPTQPEETQAFLAAEVERWTKVVREEKIPPQD
jgi:tripartite-type tricarboxylate transporter receptor subunit TctC